MIKTEKIDVEIPDGYTFTAQRPAKTGEYYLDTMTDEVKTATIDTTGGANKDKPLVILEKKPRFLRTFELVESSGQAKQGEIYSHLAKGPLQTWTFKTTSKAFFFIWREVESKPDQEKKGSENGF